MGDIKEERSLISLVCRLSENIPFSVNNDDLIELMRYFRGTKIGFDGSIAAAKSTSGQEIEKIGKQCNIPTKFIPETYDKEKLEKFYISVSKGEQPSEASYDLQLDTFNRCLKGWQEAEEYIRMTNGIVILDRTLWGNALFAALHRESNRMTKEMYHKYFSLLSTHKEKVVDYLVYLDVDPVVAHHRATKVRARIEEQTLSLEYMYQLEKANFLHVYYCFLNKRNIIVIRNDVFRTAKELLQIIKDAPTIPYDVNNINPLEIVEDSTKIRRFFANVGLYYCKGH